MRFTFHPHHRSSVTLHVGVCGGGVEQGLIFDFKSSTEYNLYVYLTYIWFICLISIMSKALGLQTLGDKLVADLAASWWFLLLGLCFSFQCAFLCLCSFPFYVFSFVNASFLCLCFLFFDELGLKEDSPSTNMSRFFQNIPRCSSFFGCCSSLGFSNEVNSQFLTAIAISSTSPKSPTNWPFHPPLTC